MRPWRCVPSTGISCARSGSSSSRWCISTDHDTRSTEPRRHRPRALRQRLPGARAIVRHVRRLVRPERPDQPRHQLEHPLPHGAAIHHRPLGVQLTAFMTFLLICSSVTMVEALAAIRQGDQRGLRRFLMLTVMGGMTFLGLQAFEWTKLIFHEGQSIARNNFGATFFILTGFHGCHVFGGVTYLSAVLGRSVRGVAGAIVTAAVAVACTLGLIAVTSATVSGLVAVIAAAAGAGLVYLVATLLAGGTPIYSAHNNNEVEIAALYWHFVDLIWILVFTFVYLI